MEPLTRVRPGSNPGYLVHVKGVIFHAVNLQVNTDSMRHVCNYMCEMSLPTGTYNRHVICGSHAGLDRLVATAVGNEAAF